jgi:glucose-1-phosphate cytidylyltransferase
MSDKKTKAVILAGGLGTRISEESIFRPKPMIEIGDQPILWHIMKIYAHYGITDFIICLGYKGYMIKEYFHHYMLHHSDVTFNFADSTIALREGKAEPWTVTLVDTGLNTANGGRLKRVAPYLQDADRFCFTYGDAVTNLRIDDLLRFHDAHGKYGTVTSVQPQGRFGSLVTDGDLVTLFEEKPAGDGAWINGGFFVLSPEAINYIDGDGDSWEQKPMQKLVADSQLCSYRHSGFWQCMDTMRDKQLLEKLWETQAPWKVWP